MTNPSGSGVQVPTTPTQTDTFKKNLIGTTDTEGMSSSARSAISVFEDFAKKFAKRKDLGEDMTVRLQTGLFGAIISTLNQNDQDFAKTWAKLLKIVKDNRDQAFHETVVFRYKAHSQMTGDRYTAYERLLTFMMLTSDPKDRPLVSRQFSFDKVAKYEVTEVGRQRLTAFYNL